MGLYGQTRRTVLAVSAAAGLSAVSGGADAAAGSEAAVRSFRAHIPQADVEDLKRRLAATRWPDRETVGDGAQGVPLARLQALVHHWGSAYDWRRAEANLNRYPQFLTRIDGVDIHFVHVRSPHPNAMPLIVSHGWPGSVFEQLKIVDPLTDPTAHGAQASDAFDVIIPSLPGYGFSGKPADIGWDPDRIARAWAVLMPRLGYSRYVAQGGDWGTPISSAMARQRAPGLQGIHINLPAAVPPEVAAALAVGGPAPPGLSEQERTAFDMLLAGGKRGSSAYFTMLSARPQTIGYGESDSPAFLAAWVLVHAGFARWSFGADPAQPLSLDDVLDDISLYWLTNSGTSSGRLYWENGGRSPLVAAAWKTQEIALPVAVTVFGEDAYQPPESWARRAYPTLSYFNRTEKGGHFAAWEQPELFAAELRAAFRPLRS